MKLFLLLFATVLSFQMKGQQIQSEFLHNVSKEFAVGTASSVEYPIGTKWIYETRNHPASSIGFQEYTVVDTILWHGKMAKIIEPGLISERDYMFEEDDKIYFWDEELEDYQLNYDFSNDESYFIKYFSPGTNNIDSTLVRIDSAQSVDINGVEHSIQYCRSTFGHGGGAGEMPFEVIRGIGSNYGGIRLPIRYIIDNFTNDVQRLRCFEDETVQYNFTEVDCDSTWIISSVGEYLPTNIKIFPNPNFGQIYIDGISNDTEFRIRDLSGRIIQEGKTVGFGIEIYNFGRLILEIREGGNWIRKKIIRIL